MRDEYFRQTKIFFTNNLYAHISNYEQYNLLQYFLAGKCELVTSLQCSPFTYIFMKVSLAVEGC
jgi:hypothetical protein